MKRIYVVTFLTIELLLSQCVFSFASAVDSTNIIDIKNGIELTTHRLNLRVQFYDNKIVRVLKWCKGGTPQKLSLSVIMDTIPALKLDVKKSDSVVFISSSDLALRISTISGEIEYRDASGNPIVEEKGDPRFIPVVYALDSGFTIQQNFQLDANEGIYGLGQNQDGYFNYRGKKEVLVQSNTNAIIPFLISTKSYGILWDNYSKTIFDDDSGCASFWSDIGSNIDYYFIRGDNMDGVISGYRQLTGRAPLFGKWAYGYWQSKEHYKTQAEVMSIGEKYRMLKMPIDNIVQDWDYWNGRSNWGGMFFDKTLYPDPKKMCDDLHKMGFHIMISIWAALGPSTAVYSDMQKRGFLYGPVGWAGFKYYDALNPAANILYCKYLDAGLFSKGIDAWWIDSTEPDVVNAMTKESEEYELKKMGRNHLGSWARYLNPFSLAMTDAVYRNWRSLTSEKRAFILTRSVFAGQQRDAAATWSGDIGASWEIFRDQISAGINFCMSGVPYWTFDIGGYVLGAYGGVFTNGGKDPAYEELYTRMFQFGVFCPVFRSHGSETPREIWAMGDFTKPILRADELRYRLLPYIYSLAWMVASKNYTMMRGLPMDFSTDPNALAVGDQFMFGPSIMVCPVTEYMYHEPPGHSVLVDKEYFKTDDGKPGLLAKYYQDANRDQLSKTQFDSDVDFVWYTGRPSYLTDSTYAVTWEGRLIPKETGKHQFHLLCYDNKRIILNGDTLRMVYTSVEQYTEPVNLIAGKQYRFVLETENNSTGAARMQLYWKTPSIFAKERIKSVHDKEVAVYLPCHHKWYNFWTGDTIEGGKEIRTKAPIDIIPLFVKAGSIIPLGPFIQYSTEKAADPIELRIYRGADGAFTLYEDEDDNYDYEKGIYSTIEFSWSDSSRELTIGALNGKYPGMLSARTFNVVLVSKDHGTGIAVSKRYDKVIQYSGDKVVVKF